MQHLSAQDALVLARTSISDSRNARNAEGSKSTIINNYRDAKRALDRVIILNTDPSSLKEMIATFQDLALVLDDSGERKRASKCRQRADALRMKNCEAAVIPSLVAIAFSAAIAQAEVSSFEIIQPPNSATLSSVAISTANAAGTTTSQQLPPLSSRTTISVSATRVIPTSLMFFSEDVNPEPYIYLLPGPDKPFQTTRQLAYGLALLQVSDSEGDLSPEDLEWRHSTLSNLTEKDRLEALSCQIIRKFTSDSVKNAALVVEVVQLAPVLNGEWSRSLLKAFIDAVNNSEILELHSLEGLGKAIQGAAPGSIDSGDLVTILRSLHKRLQPTHSENHQYRLLLATSRVLDAMVDAHNGGINRVNLHGPLTHLLRDSESGENPYLIYQAAYATQALLNVSDDDDIWRAGLRRLWIVLKGGAGFAKMPNPTEIKDALEGLERFYEFGKGGVRTIKDLLESIKNRERPTFTAEEGLKFKRAWYRAIRTAELYIQTGRLALFKNLVATAPCRHQFMFQWGICQLLGQFASDTQWPLESRQEVVAFFEALHKVDVIWNKQKGVDQVIFDALSALTSINDTQFAAAKTLLKEIGKQDTMSKLKASTQSQLWNCFRLTDPAGQTTVDSTLLDAVQNRNRRHAKLENLPDPGRQPSLDDIRSALEKYHEPDLSILRVSGQTLDLKTCFVNLAIVEAPEHQQKEKEDLKAQAEVFHRIPSFERVQNTNTQSLIPLDQLFDKRKLRDGREIAPKRILVQGRAGIGKTTLCKKLVHAHQNGQWRDLFDAVLWLPLRQLRGFKGWTLEGLFREKVFTTYNLNQEQEALALALATHAQNGRVLFILDGLDEIVADTGSEDSKTFRSFLKTLLGQHHVIITSRPSGLDSKILPSIDLELETVGFSQQNVNEFIVKVLEPEAARTVQDFIQQTPLIQGLVNIPVQLDVICFSWDSLPSDGTAVTMTGLYQLMVRKLWCKDAIRLKKTAGGIYLTEQQLSRFKPKKIDLLMATELQHLGYLAFKGMDNDHQIEFDEDTLVCAFEDLDDDEAIDNQQLLPPQLLEVMKQTSFLHTVDAVVDNTSGISRQAWHFLHLTFQEYFAATWIARHFHLQQPYLSAGMMTNEKFTAFVHRHKYNPRYEIAWSMVAGLLEGESLGRFFRLLQGGPRDLIGGRHQQILTSCLNEARTRLDPAEVEALDSELVKWLRFEMQICQNDRYQSRSMLGSRPSFPDSLLIKTLGSLLEWKGGSLLEWKVVLLRTLGSRSTLSNSAIQYLATSLKDGDNSVRHSAASALGNQSTLSESVLQSLVAALEDDDEEVRYSAASALRNQSSLSESVLQALVDALEDDDEEVRYSAASALGNQSSLSESVVQSIVAALKDDDRDVRSSAALALGNQSTLSESVIQCLVAALKDDDRDVRSSAAEALGNQSSLSESVIQALVDALKDDDEDVRSSAASALGNQSSLSESVIQALDALKDNDENVRYKVTEALGNQSTLSESVIQALFDALKDNDEDHRSSAADALGNQSTLSESVLQSLAAALNDDKWYVRYSAAFALGNQSTLSESVLQSLVAALEDDDEEVRYSAASALGNQSTLSESVLQSLVAALKNDNEDVRWFAADALGDQSTLPESVLQALVDALEDDDEFVGSSAAEALGNQSMLSESVIQSLAAALRDDDENVRSSAASALRKQPALSISVIRSLITTLEDEHTAGRNDISTILGAHSHSLCISLLYLADDEIACLYKYYLFLHSCNYVLSLQVLDGALSCYTEHGVSYSEPIRGGKEEALLSAFRAARHKAGLPL